MSKPQINILIVDDDAVDRFACRRALMQPDTPGIVLWEAETGREGLQLVHAQRPDCILLDYRMPDMDGLEFLTELAGEDGRMPAPIVMLTGADNAAVAVEAMKRGARDYLIKDAQRQYLELLSPVIDRVLREQRVAEEKAEAEAKYRALVEQIPAITYIAALDDKGGIRYISPQIRTLGFSAEEWLADPGIHYKHIHPDDRVRVMDEVAKSSASGSPLRCEYRLLARNGQALWFRDEASVVSDAAGRPLFLQGILLDVTKSKQMEEELRQHRYRLEELVDRRTDMLTRANEQLREEIVERKRAEEALKKYSAEVHDLYNNAPCGYYSLDKEGAFVQINDTALDWFGYAREDVVGKKNVADLLTPTGLRTFQKNFPRFKEQGWVRDLEFDFVRKDGTVMPALLNATAIKDAGGNFVMSRSTIFDITEHKRLEELRQSQEILRRLAAHRESVAEEERKRIAREIHDGLGQQLMALRLEAKLLSDHFEEAHSGMAKKAGSMPALVDATIETVRNVVADLRPAVLDLGLVPAIEWQVEEFQNRSGITCELVAGMEEIELPDNRATAMFRILQESLTNVARHAHATKVKISLNAERGMLFMKIQDNGIGIGKGSLKKAKSFGLLGIRERALLLGGEVLVVTGPEGGTELTVSIPISENGEVPYGAPASPPAGNSAFAGGPETF